MISTADLNRWIQQIISTIDFNRWSPLNNWSKQMISKTDLNRWTQQIGWQIGWLNNFSSLPTTAPFPSNSLSHNVWSYRYLPYVGGFPRNPQTSKHVTCLVTVSCRVRRDRCPLDAGRFRPSIKTRIGVSSFLLLFFTVRQDRAL